MEEININTKENASAKSMFIVFANLIRDDDLNTMEMFPEEFLCSKTTWTQFAGFLRTKAVNGDISKGTAEIYLNAAKLWTKGSNDKYNH